MGCGCAGSTPRQPAQGRQQERQVAADAARRSGMPGEPGYTWNGPTVARPVEAPAR